MRGFNIVGAAVAALLAVSLATFARADDIITQPWDPQAKIWQLPQSELDLGMQVVDLHMVNDPVGNTYVAFISGPWSAAQQRVVPNRNLYMFKYGFLGDLAPGYPLVVPLNGVESRIGAILADSDECPHVGLFQSNLLRVYCGDGDMQELLNVQPIAAASDDNSYFYALFKNLNDGSLRVIKYRDSLDTVWQSNPLPLRMTPTAAWQYPLANLTVGRNGRIFIGLSFPETHESPTDYISQITVLEPGGTVSGTWNAGQRLDVDGRIGWLDNFGEGRLVTLTIGNDFDQHVIGYKQSGDLSWTSASLPGIEHQFAVGPDGSIFVLADNDPFVPDELYRFTPAGLQSSVNIGDLDLPNVRVTAKGSVYIAGYLRAQDAIRTMRYAVAGGGTFATAWTGPFDVGDPVLKGASLAEHDLDLMPDLGANVTEVAYRCTQTSGATNPDGFLLTRISEEPPVQPQTGRITGSFKTKGQSIWKSGTLPGEGNYSMDLVKVPINLDTGIGGFFDVGFSIHIPWPINKTIRISIGRFGGRVGLSAHGEGKLTAKAKLSAGDIRVDVPFVADLEAPGPNDPFMGTSFMLQTVLTRSPNGSFNVNPAVAKASLTASLQGNADLRVQLTAFSRDLINGSIWNPQVNEKRDIFTIDDITEQRKDFNFNNYAYGFVQIPHVRATGSGAGLIDGTGSDAIMSVRSDITNWITSAFGIPTSIGPKTEGLPGGSYTWGARILQAFARVNVDLVQQFSVDTGLPKMVLTDLDTGTPLAVELNGQMVTSFPATSIVKVTFPAGKKRLRLRPSVRIPSPTLRNQTRLAVTPQTGFEAAAASLSAQALGYRLLSVGGSWGNTVTDIAKFDIGLLDNTFGLQGFQAVNGEPFVIRGNTTPPIVLGTSRTGREAALYDQVAVDDDYLGVKQDFQARLVGVTAMLVFGKNFNVETKVHISHLGRTQELPTVFLNDKTLRTEVPNDFFVLPGIASIWATKPTAPNPDDAGDSNSCAFPVELPAPVIDNAGPNVWAASPDFKDLLFLIHDGEDGRGNPTFIARFDYDDWLIKLWNGDGVNEGMFPGTDVQTVFPNYRWGTEATLPRVFVDDEPAPSFREPVPNGQLVFKLSSKTLGKARFSRVHITAGAPGGGESPDVQLMISAPKPEITQLLPDRALPGSSKLTLVVKGPDAIKIDGVNRTSNFNADSVVLWNGTPRPTTFLSSSELHAEISENDLKMPGNANVTVASPANDTYWLLNNVRHDSGGTSNVLKFKVMDTAPAIETVAPPSISALYASNAIEYHDVDSGESFRRFTLKGSGFTKGSKVYVNGTLCDAVLKSEKPLGMDEVQKNGPEGTTQVSSTISRKHQTLDVSVPEAWLVTPGTLSFEVRTAGKPNSNVVQAQVVTRAKLNALRFAKAVVVSEGSVNLEATSDLPAPSDGLRVGVQSDSGSFVLPGDNFAIKPGQTIGTLKCVVPKVAAAQTFTVRARCETNVEFTATVTVAPAKGSLEISTTVPLTMVAGQSYAATVKFKNKGATPWTRAAGFQLGSVNPSLNTIWGLSTVTLGAGETIAYGQTKAFQFNVVAPSTPGTYTFQWRMRQDPTGFFGPSTVSQTVQVQAAGGG